jgi:hypothetical protein
MAHPEALNRDAGDFAGQAVAPTLLAAGAGIVVVGVTTAAAILSPDYATAVRLAAPLERMRGVKSALRLGALICAGDALGRLASASWIVLDEHEAWHRSGCEVAGMGARRLGVDRYCGEMRREDKIRLLCEMRQQRIAAVYIGGAPLKASVVREAKSSIALIAADGPRVRTRGHRPAGVVACAAAGPFRSCPRQREANGARASDRTGAQSPLRRRCVPVRLHCDGGRADLESGYERGLQPGKALARLGRERAKMRMSA